MLKRPKLLIDSMNSTEIFNNLEIYNEKEYCILKDNFQGFFVDEFSISEANRFLNEKIGILKEFQTGIYEMRDANSEIYLDYKANDSYLGIYDDSDEENDFILENNEFACYPDEYLSEVPFSYGVCDNYNQILDICGDFLNESERKFCIILNKFTQLENDFRWHKWGQYIGKHCIKCEHFHDEDLSDIEQDFVYIFHIYELGE